MQLTKTDVKVLNTLSTVEGAPHPNGITAWGAAVGASIEALRGAGYVRGHTKIEITDAGRAALLTQLEDTP